MRDIAVVDVREEYCTVSVFSEGWAEGRSKGSAVIKGRFSDVSSGTAPKVARGLETLSSGPEVVILLLPRHLFNIVFIDLPARDEDVLDKMLTYEVGRYFPVSAENLLYHHLVIGRNPNGFSLMVAGIKKSDFDRYFNVSTNAGIFPDIVSVSSYGLLPNALGDHKRTVVDFEPDGFELSLLNGKCPVYSHYVRFKPPIEEHMFIGSGIFAAEAVNRAANSLLSEMKHIRLVGGIDNLSEYLECLIVTGGGNLLPGIVEKLHGSLEFSSSKITQVSALKDADPLAHISEMASMAGLQKKHATFNLIPKNMRKMRHVVVRRLLALAGVVIVALLLIWGGVSIVVHMNTLRKLKGELARLKHEAVRNETVMVKMEEYKAYFDEFNKFSSERKFDLALMDSLTTALPRTTYITDLEFHPCTLTVSGISTDAPSILDSLERSPAFRNAHMIGEVKSVGAVEKFKVGLECK